MVDSTGRVVQYVVKSGSQRGRFSSQVAAEMSIETQCPQCSKLLRVPDSAAGKRVRCPSCQTVISMPAGGSAAGAAGSSPGAASSTAGSAGAGQWSVQTEDGQMYGPISKAELDQWVAEARVTAGCQLLQEGAAQWQWAADVYPQLAAGQAAPQVAAPSPRAVPAAGPQIQTGGPTKSPFEVSDNPYASPSGGGTHAGGASTMRGRNIPNHLPMAIFALLCCCWAFAIPALVYSVQANSKKAAGDYVGAARAASNAQMWIYISIGVGIVTNILGAVAQVALEQQ